MCGDTKVLISADIDNKDLGTNANGVLYVDQFKPGDKSNIFVLCIKAVCNFTPKFTVL